MKRATIPMAAALLGMMLLGSAAAAADPMLCSGTFYKSCLSDCSKMANKAATPSCITNCRVLLTRCTQTGCWDGPTNRYCTLLRK